MPENQTIKANQYYAKTANWYDEAQLHENDEHYNALMFLRGVIAEKNYQSILDIGCGTGRALIYLKEAFPSLQTVGLEPVKELGEIAISKDLNPEQIIIGSGQFLPFEENSFDCVTAFGVLHHIEQPKEVISEMFRVAKRGVFISDHNIYGMGSKLTKSTKIIIRKIFGFEVLKYIMTQGLGYHDTDYDGIFYPFSIFEYLSIFNQKSNKKFLFSTKGNPDYLYSEASHVAVLSDLD